MWTGGQASRVLAAVTAVFGGLSVIAVGLAHSEPPAAGNGAGAGCESDKDCGAGLVCSLSRRCLPDASPAPQAEPAEDAPDARWSWPGVDWDVGPQPYVLQVLPADAVLVAISAASAEQGVVASGAFEAVMVTGPIVHLANEEPLKASISLAARIGAWAAAQEIVDCLPFEARCIRNQTLVATAMGSAFDLAGLGWWDSSLVYSDAEPDEYDRYWSPMLAADAAVVTLAGATDEFGLLIGVFVSGAAVHALHAEVRERQRQERSFAL